MIFCEKKKIIKLYKLLEKLKLYTIFINLY